MGIDGQKGIVFLHCLGIAILAMVMGVVTVWGEEYALAWVDYSTTTVIHSLISIVSGKARRMIVL